MLHCKTYQINLAFIAPQNLVNTDTLCIKLSPLVYWRYYREPHFGVFGKLWNYNIDCFEILKS